MVCWGNLSDHFLIYNTMQIIEETQLDFSDVLIKPRRSTLSSRKEADLNRKYKFKWHDYSVIGTGIMQSNMGTIGNFEVSRKLLKNGLFACLHKYHSVSDLVKFYDSLTDDEFERCFVSIGLRTSDNNLGDITAMVMRSNRHKYPPICIDVPNAYIPQVKELVVNIRKNMPGFRTIMVGNVVTGDVTEDLILSGADIVKIGIGNGAQCIQSGTNVITKDGRKQIQDIIEGDEVLTHTGEYHKVTGTICHENRIEKININGITCTPEHKFLVINKCDKKYVNEENLMKYAYWVEAIKLDNKKQLIVTRKNITLEFIEIEKSEIFNNNENVYDIEVEKDHSFVVGDGIVVHNCLTRKQTGCGRPQFSAIVECADAAHQVGGMVCADGGITCPGDIGKAFGAGADFIMIGSMFAGTDEADGEVIEKYYNNGEYDKSLDNKYSPVCEKKLFKQFYGMSSTLAQEKFGNGKPSYRASEGRVTLVPYVGSIDGVIEEFLGGLRSTMTYLGAKRLKDIPKCCVFYKVHNQLNKMYENNTIGK